ncbi:MAG: hypothetical protein ACLSB9_29995 [Hydrogeniiclostridium mannosilyticum]
MDNYLKAALSVEQLKVSYVQNKKRLPVLDGISFVLEKERFLLCSEKWFGEIHLWEIAHRRIAAIGKN